MTDWYTKCAEGWEILICAEAEVEESQWETLDDHYTPVNKIRSFPITPTSLVGYALHHKYHQIVSELVDWDYVLKLLGVEYTTSLAETNEATIQAKHLASHNFSQDMLDTVHQMLKTCDWLSACEVDMAHPTLIGKMQAIFYRKDKRQDVLQLLKQT